MQCLLDFGNAQIAWFALGIAVNEEKFARIQIKSQVYSLAHGSPTRKMHPARVRPPSLQWQSHSIRPQQPGENGQQDDIGTSIRHESESQIPHLGCFIPGRKG